MITPADNIDAVLTGLYDSFFRSLWRHAFWQLEACLMHTGFNNHTDFDRTTHFHRCERCHTAVKVPCCHFDTNNANHVSNVNRQNSTRGSLYHSNIRFVELSKAKGEPLVSLRLQWFIHSYSMWPDKNPKDTKYWMDKSDSHYFPPLYFSRKRSYWRCLTIRGLGIPIKPP